MLWATSYETGDPVIGNAVAVEAVSEFPGKPGILADALARCGGDGRAGFIEPVPADPTRYQIRDLFDHAPDYVKKRRQRESERKTRAADGDHSPTLSPDGGQCPPRAADGDHSPTLAENGAPPTPTPTPTPIRGMNPPKTPSCSEPAPPASEPASRQRKRAAVNHANGFDRFWEAYPRKVGKLEAEKSWQRLAPAASKIDAILVALERHKASDEWAKNGGAFIAHPATWLNGERWNDELRAPAAGDAAGLSDDIDDGSPGRTFTDEEFNLVFLPLPPDPAVADAIRTILPACEQTKIDWIARNFANRVPPIGPDAVQHAAATALASAGPLTFDGFVELFNNWPEVP